MATRLQRRDEEPVTRRATNVSLDVKLVDSARELGINVSQACENGLAKQVREERGRQWLEENQEAIAGYNAWIAEHGLPLEKYRMF